MEDANHITLTIATEGVCDNLTVALPDWSFPREYPDVATYNRFCDMLEMICKILHKSLPPDLSGVVLVYNPDEEDTAVGKLQFIPTYEHPPHVTKYERPEEHSIINVSATGSSVEDILSGAIIYFDR